MTPILWYARRPGIGRDFYYARMGARWWGQESHITTYKWLVEAGSGDLPKREPGRQRRKRTLYYPDLQQYWSARDDH